MMRKTYPDLTLAISLSARGFAYVFFEASEAPFDWAVVEVKGQGKSEHIIQRAHKLLCLYRPQTLVLEDLSAKSARRPERARKLSLSLRHMAQCEGIEVSVYDRQAIRAAFAPVGANTKREIAQAVALAIPAFGHRLPPERKIWMSEDARQSLFDAAAIGMVHFSGK